MKIRITGIVLLLFIIASCQTKKEQSVNMRIGPQPDGSILVPSNQLLRPAGFQVNLPGRPVDLALTPDGRFLLVKNKADVDLIRLSDRTILQTLPFQKSGASFTGICLSADGKSVYVTDADNRLCIAEFDENRVLHWTDPVILPAPGIEGSPFPGGMAVSEDGNTVYVTLSRNNSLAAVDLKGRSKIKEIPVGVAPYNVVISGNKAYVTNWGGRHVKEGESSYKSSGTPVLVDQKTGIASSGTVSVVDLEKGLEVKHIKTGLHPCGMALSPDAQKLYVACANSDIVNVIDTEQDEVVDSLSVHENDKTPFGSSPNDLCLSPDGKYLYVSNGTDNAICIINTEKNSVEGYIPTGWYPGTVVTDRQGKMLFVANVKGTGSRNPGTYKKGFNSHDHLGSVSIIPVPSRSELAEMSQTVLKNNLIATGRNAGKRKKSGKVPVPDITGQGSVFKHVVYILKENRTYDQVFGDLSQGDGDSSLVMFGRNVTPNHHRLAEEFVLLDNFYCSGVLSADGHQWTDEAIVTDYLEKSFGNFTRSYPYDGDDPLAYASSGFIWDNVLKHGLTFRNYGEFVNAVIEPSNASFSEIYKDYLEKTGNIKISAKANLDQLAPYLCPAYIGFPNTVSDQYRADEFIKELENFEKNDNFPNFIIMLLPNDHTSGTRPGMPVPVAAVADNDLALGRIVEAISKSKFWNETCILVTEDDPQNGFDHVDGHRTVGMVISPYTKRGEVVSTYYSQVNMVRTIENILGIPPMNQLDLSSEPMSDCFTSKPDFSPYNAVKNNIPLDSLNASLSSISGDRLYWAKKSLEQDLDDVDRIDDDTFNRIIWHAVKGYDVPYPVMNR